MTGDVTEAAQARGRKRFGDIGAGFVEYALLIALIVMVCLVAMTALGRDTGSRVDDTASRVDAAS